MENNVLDISASKFVDKMEKEFPTWFEKLNLVVGLTAIGFSVIAYKSDYPEIFAFIGLLIILGVMASIKHYFPADLKKLRNKEEKTNLEKIILIGIEKKYLGFSKLFTNGSIFLIGMISLIAMISGFKGLFIDKILPLIS